MSWPRSHSRSRSGDSPQRRSRPSSASESMGLDGGEAGRMVAAEEEYIRRELQDTNAFCNAFWGTGDAGYETVQARMKTANRTMDEVRSLYKERAEIEADYAKRLGKLAKVSVGKDETGATKAALDVVRAELDMTSRVHSDLSAMIRKDLEGALAEFQSKATSSRKNSAAAIEKLYKNKQAQENYVNKSRERYEQDCIKINGYTAQSSLVQGRDLDKVTSKLDKAQSTVATNDKDYQNFVRALKDTTFRWNGEWKAYLDQCQDLEEDRLEFIKSNLWNYANALSAVCVADDEGCERVRVALESCETGADIADFIQFRGTGAAIPDPPEYINYAKGQPPPARPSYKTANFQRTSTRSSAPPPPPPQSQSFAGPTHRGGGGGGGGGGAGGGGDLPSSSDVGNRSNGTSPAHQTAAVSNHHKPPPGAVALPEMAALSLAQDEPAAGAVTNGQQYHPAQSPAAVAPPAIEKAEKRMSTKNFLARTPSKRGGGGEGSSAIGGSSQVPTNQQQQQQQQPPSTSLPDSTSAPDEDPIAKALANLRARPGGRSPAPNSPAAAAPSRHSHQAPGAGSVAAHDPRRYSQNPPRSPSPSVGGGMHRPSSPAAAFMQAPHTPSSPIPVEEVLGSYGQSFPGERRRSVSRQNSVSSAISSRSNAHQQQAGGAGAGAAPQPSAAVNNADGFAGVGARGRSPSPQPFGRQQQQQPQQQQPRRPTSTAPTSGPPHRQQQQQQQPPQRSSTPLGISLDASGSVTHDQMAQEYMRRAGSVPPPSQQQQHQSQQQQHPSHRMSRAPSQQQQQQQHPYYSQQQHQPQRPASVVYGSGQPQAGSAGPYQNAPPPAGQVSSTSSSYTITPGTYSGHPQQQQPPLQPQSQHNQYYSSHQQQPSAPAQYGQQAQAAPQFAQQDSTSSLGRASGYNNYAQHQPQPSASQSLHGGNMSQQQDTPASAYMQQYRGQQHQPQASTPGPYNNNQPQQPTWSQQSGAGAGGVAQPQQQSYSQQAPPPPAATSPGPAPAPTGQYSDTGKPILFYVKAMYDYSATTDEEFSFTTGDIIAVTQTDPDGWWQGELLDEARRRRGATTFPSNFTTLLT